MQAPPINELSRFGLRINQGNKSAKATMPVSANAFAPVVSMRLMRRYACRIVNAGARKTAVSSREKERAEKRSAACGELQAALRRAQTYYNI